MCCRLAVEARGESETDRGVEAQWLYRSRGRIAVGGKRPANLPKGYYVEPTILTDVKNSMKVAQEEIFGPVLVVIRYKNIDDAIRIANDSIYGLGGAVWSRDTDKAMAVAKQVRTGTMWVNGGTNACSAVIAPTTQARKTLCQITALKMSASRPIWFVPAVATQMLWASIILPITPPVLFAVQISTSA